MVVESMVIKASKVRRW